LNEVASIRRELPAISHLRALSALQAGVAVHDVVLLSNGELPVRRSQIWCAPILVVQILSLPKRGPLDIQDNQPNGLGVVGPEEGSNQQLTLREEENLHPADRSFSLARRIETNLVKIKFANQPWVRCLSEALRNNESQNRAA
jgi:hypothetical protein